MKSFYETLIENGYSRDEANGICVMIENDIQIKDEKILKLHHYWVMGLIAKGENIISPELN